LLKIGCHFSIDRFSRAELKVKRDALPTAAVNFLEPERLRAFVMVAETGSFTRAAERLHLTQPAISAQVRRLGYDTASGLGYSNPKARCRTAPSALARFYAERAFGLPMADRSQIFDDQTETSSKYEWRMRGQ
jgi:Bacterial regulatory helix-turn-helix protein, lysR family